MQQIKPITQAEEIAWCFEAFKELRPHLNERGTFVQKVIEQQKQGYQIFVISEGGEVVACIGFRIMSMLAWGKILYIDDLITKEKCRGKGYGKALLEHAAHIAKDRGCYQIHLDTGYARHAAHKLYLNQGFEFNCHHLAFKVKQDCLNF
jgi:GNAT superfamily N-acetyltransferase